MREERNSGKDSQMLEVTELGKSLAMEREGKQGVSCNTDLECGDVGNRK